MRVGRVRVINVLCKFMLQRCIFSAKMDEKTTDCTNFPNGRPANRQGNPNMKKGAPAVNPKGRPAAGFQSFKDRLAYWLDTKTIGEIRKIVEDEKKFDKLVAIDALVARRISEASKQGSTSDFASILDRLVGKPNQAITGADGAPLMPVTDIQELARRTAFLLSLGVQQAGDAAVVINGAPALPAPIIEVTP